MFREIFGTNQFLVRPLANRKDNVSLFTGTYTCVHQQIFCLAYSIKKHTGVSSLWLGIVFLKHNEYVGVSEKAQRVHVEVTEISGKNIDFHVVWLRKLRADS